MALDTTIGGASSDSYVTLAEWQAYWDARGIDLTQHGHDASHEANLRRAADVLDATYQWVGLKQYKVQARGWPRVWTPLIDGYAIDPDTIPQAIKNAQMELAYLIHEGADPFATYDGAVKREKVDVIEVEYQGGKGRPMYTGIDRILRDYVKAGAGQIAMVRG